MTWPRVALATAAAMGLVASVEPGCSRGSSAAASPGSAPAATGATATQATLARSDAADGGGRASPIAEARRVVSISPATTETAFAIGAGDRVVGRSRFCDWPPEVTKLPIVGGVIDADFEAIVQLSPDLLVGGPGPAATKLSEKLSPLGIATWFPNVDSLQAIEAMVLEMGERTGHVADAHRLVEGTEGIEARVAAVERAVAAEAAPRVLMVVDVSPVVGTGPNDFIDDLIHRARGANVLSTGAPWQTLDFEQIAEFDPDLIIDASNANGGHGASNVVPTAPGWTNVRAVREGHVVTLADPRVLRPGPRVAEGLAILARVLHPHAPVPSW